MSPARRVIPFSGVGREDVSVVGGKNASLGEMVVNLGPAGVRVPDGFASTADAYREFLETGGLRQQIVEQVALLHKGVPLDEAGAAIRDAMLRTPLPPALERELAEAYTRPGREAGQEDPAVAVRSSATAEDLPEASFAGQQETFLNVRAARRCWTPAGAVTPRCSPTGRSTTASGWASTSSRWHSRSACS